MPCSSHSLDAHYGSVKGLTAVECEFPVKGTQGLALNSASPHVEYHQANFSMVER